MAFYKFKAGAAGYGLGYVDGEVAEIDDAKGIDATALVPEVDSDGKQTFRMIVAKKNYKPAFLMEAGILLPANSDDVAKYKAKLAEEAAAAKAGK